MMEKRDSVVDSVVVGVAVQVFEFPDGSLTTGTPYAVSTSTVAGTPLPVSTPPPSPTPSPEPKPAAVFAAEVPSSAPVVPAPAPTTLAKVVAPSVAPVVPTPSHTSAPVTTSGGDQGLAYNDLSLLEGFVGSKAAWCYNWDSTPGGAVPSQFEYVPMLWGLNSDHLDGWSAAAQSAIDSGSTHLLGFNEPDLGAQSNLSPQAAAAGWSNMEAFASKAKLGSPSITSTSGSQTMGVPWLTSFLSACSDCTIDFVTFHWYGTTDQIDAFEQHVKDVATAAGGRPIWLTEFGATGSVAQQQAFLDQAVPFLEGMASVERFAYFYVAEGNMVTGGSPNALGKTFADLS